MFVYSFCYYQQKNPGKMLVVTTSLYNICELPTKFYVIAPGFLLQQN